MIPSAEEMLTLAQSDNKKDPYRLGTIVSGHVRFDGEDTPSLKIYKRLSSYTISNGDRVLLAAMAGTYVILGRVV